MDIVDVAASVKAQPRSARRLSRLVRASLRRVWQADKLSFTVVVALQLVAAGALAGQVFVVEDVLAAILDLPDGGGVGPLVLPLTALAVLTAVATTAAAMRAHVERLLGERVSYTLWQEVLAQATGVDLRTVEDPTYHDRLSRIETNALYRPYQVTEGLVQAIGALAAGVGLTFALVRIHPVLIVLLLVGGVPLLITNRLESRREFAFAVEQTPNERMSEYLTELMTGRDEAAELRAYGMAPSLRRRLGSLHTSYVAALRSHLTGQSALTGLGSIGAAATLVATLLVLAWLISLGTVGVPAAGAAVVAIRALAGQVQGLADGLRHVFESGLFLDDLETFVAVREPEGGAGAEAPAAFDRITVEDVSFTYPGAEVPALDGVSMSIAAGQVVALVGENGSGKSTLAKVVAGLYDPGAGAVRWDGVPTTSFERRSLRSRVTVVFQSFQRYAMSATENISIGRPDEDVDTARVRAAARAAGIDSTLAALPRGYDTVLSRWFEDGTDLSGGQWQRVAMARAYYRDAPLVILDEPTAAMDPKAEHHLFSTVRTILAGRTALIISHRFSTVRSADHIYVLAEGKVVEHGTHAELMAADGGYAEMFRLQAAAYGTVEREAGTVG